MLAGIWIALRVMLGALSVYMFLKSKGKSGEEAWKMMNGWFEEHRKDWGVEIKDDDPKYHPNA
jgi:hypothetical protein